jgi:hypothetical protein
LTAHQPFRNGSRLGTGFWMRGNCLFGVDVQFEDITFRIGTLRTIWVNCKSFPLAPHRLATCMLWAVFNKDNPPPDLSKYPRQTSGDFALSAFPWPQTNPDPHRTFDLYRNPFVELHVSVTNLGALASAGWNACHVIIEAGEVRHAIGPAPNPPAHVSKRTVYPCDWNGDLSHGAIAAGATVAFEVEAKLPEVCHLASPIQCLGEAGKRASEVRISRFVY